MKRTMVLTSVVLTLLLGASTALAQDGDYELDWWTTDGGGVTGQDRASGYFLGGTVGQPDAATWTDGGYTLSGGFWFTGPAVAGYAIFLPVIVRGGS